MSFSFCFHGVWFHLNRHPKVLLTQWSEFRGKLNRQGIGTLGRSQMLEYERVSHERLQEFLIEPRKHPRPWLYIGLSSDVKIFCFEAKNTTPRR